MEQNDLDKTGIGGPPPENIFPSPLVPNDEVPNDGFRKTYHPTYSTFPELKMYTQCIKISEFSAPRIEESVYPRNDDFGKEFPTLEKQMFQSAILNIPTLKKPGVSHFGSEDILVDIESDDGREVANFQTFRYQTTQGSPSSQLSIGTISDSDDDSEENQSEERFFPNNQKDTNSDSADFEDLFSDSGNEDLFLEEEQESSEEPDSDTDLEDRADSTYEKYKYVMIVNQAKATRPSNLPPEIKSKYSNEAEIEMDKTIKEALQNERIFENTPTIDTKIVNQITFERNPLVSATAKDYYDFPAFSNNPIITAYCVRNKRMSFTRSLPSPMKNCIPMDPVFRSELDSLSQEPNLEDIQFDASRSVLKPNFVFERDLIRSLPRASKWLKFDYTKLSLLKFEIGHDFIEPIICSAFLYVENRVLTERWVFAPIQSVDILNNCGIKVEPKHRACFELNGTEAYLVIELRRVLLVNNGHDVNQFYLDPKNGKLLQKAKQCINKSFPRTKDIFTTFGVIAVPLGRIISSKGGLELPQPYIINQPATTDLLDDMIFRNKAPSRETLPWKITIKAKLTKAYNNRILQDKGYYVYNQIFPKLNVMRNQFINRIFFRIDNLVLRSVPKKIKARNIFAKICIRNSNSEILKFFISPLTGLREYYVTTVCWYHNEKPTFHETFACELPFPVPKGLYFEVVFYHGIAQDNSAQFHPIGKSIIILTDSDGIFTPVGHRTPIYFDMNKTIDTINCPDNGECQPTAKNYIETTTKVRSSLHSQDPAVQKIFIETMQGKFINPESFNGLTTRGIKENFFDIVSILVTFISKQPWRFVQAFVKLTEIGAPHLGEDFQTFLQTFALRIAFSDTGSYLNMHTPLFFAWSEYLRTHKENVDGPTVSFFFLLILKSMYLSNDNKYMTAIETFTTLWMRHLYPQPLEISMQRLTPFIWFIISLFDIGKYSAAALILKLFIQHGFEKVKHLKVIDKFIRKVMTPKLFYTLSIYSNQFRDTYLAIFTRIFAYMNDEYFTNIFGALLRNTMMYTPEMNRKLAERYSGLKGFKSPIQGAFYSEADLSNISREEFDTYWSNTDHKGFFRMLHFYLVTYEYKGKEIPSDETTRRNKEIIHALQRGIIIQLRLLSRITNPLDISEVTLVYFHITSSNLAIDNIPQLYYAFAELLTLNLDQTVLHSDPVISHILRYVLMDSIIDRFSSSLVIDCLFPDGQTMKSYGRSYAAIAMTIGIMNYKDCLKVKLELKKEGGKFVPKFILVKGNPIDKALKDFAENQIFSNLDQPSDAIHEYTSYIESNKEKMKQPLPKFKK